MEILKECIDYNEANKQEIIYIEKYNTIVPKGYNISPGGGSHSCEVKEMLSEKAKKRFETESNPMLGKERKDLKEYNKRYKNKSFEDRYGIEKAVEIKNKMSEKRKGKKFTEEHKKKIGISNKGNKRPDLTERNLKRWNEYNENINR